MMRIIEKSSDHLRLSNADMFRSKWGFVVAIVAIILSGIFISAKVIHPACWSGVVLGCFLLFMLVRELPRSFDTEFWFDRKSDQLKVIKRPWLGRPHVEYCPLANITGTRVVARAQNKHNYPGHDYDDAETQSPIESPEYDVELSMQSGSTLTVIWGHGEYGATQLALSVAEFLGLTLTTV